MKSLNACLQNLEKEEVDNPKIPRKKKNFKEENI